MSVVTVQPRDASEELAFPDFIDRPCTQRIRSKGHLYVVPASLSRHEQSSAGASVRPPKVHDVPAETSASFRRTAVTGVIGLILAVSIGGFGGWLAQPDPYSGQTTVTSVAPGQSLWSIAAELDIHGRSVDQVVNDIRDLNGLESNHLDVGQPLVIPAP
ncbi:MAG: LysM peptidoglycan-binding domain-containing protein [Actinomycetaceae bacterium]|nr:LysM peptidoglycan-binding domain-containing protein [Actinomycetaceae bacterium]